MILFLDAGDFTHAAHYCHRESTVPHHQAKKVSPPLFPIWDHRRMTELAIDSSSPGQPPPPSLKLLSAPFYQKQESPIRAKEPLIGYPVSQPRRSFLSRFIFPRSRSFFFPYAGAYIRTTCAVGKICEQGPACSNHCHNPLFSQPPFSLISHSCLLASRWPGTFLRSRPNSNFPFLIPMIADTFLCFSPTQIDRTK